MNRKLQLALGTLLVFAATLAFACDYPERPLIPDGSNSSKKDMMFAKDQVADFLKRVDEYLNCIESGEKDALAELTDPEPADLKRRDKMLGKKFDAANDEKALVGEEFNQQVRAYNAARQAAE